MVWAFDKSSRVLSLQKSSSSLILKGSGEAGLQSRQRRAICLLLRTRVYDFKVLAGHNMRENRLHLPSILILYRSPLCSRIDQRPKHNISAKGKMLTRIRYQKAHHCTDNKVRCSLCGINFGQPLFIQQKFGVFLGKMNRYVIFSDVIYVNRLWDTSVNSSIIYGMATW